ncbi:PPP2R1A-PPP2R2A-interacting phosphatase regulator 1 isoform X3 [Phymastichus coffea]|nr:PPP2R1A-PPP2R2A-interacting phosphatase regulator 1 isoform X2 [Phymastichus coffea]XP_058789090.1 PPP2R1A-PPP2R2A-interacting phosphatase regulator 1 isoform X3 [Phymastichus coffea]XP_058789091.1 PPP2R1A-PPP2R2A-interacting phosphatase regulator 1 isoform X3 [Phymastichus coffea]
MFLNNIQHPRQKSININCSMQTNLKRSSSAPVINEISTITSIDSPSITISPMLRDTVSTFNIFSSIPRIRRFSTSMSNNSIGTVPKFTLRVNQLRQEECIDAVAGREAAHEKEIHSTMQISQSWEDLTFETEGLSFKDSSAESSSSILSNSSKVLSQLKTEKKMISKKTSDFFSLNRSGKIPSQASLSPSQKNMNEQHCYSPNFHVVTWKNSSLSPSPTRKAFATRRSLSPIAIRPSCLGANMSAVKRKFELDGNKGSDRLFHPPLKRVSNLIIPNIPR